MLASRIRKLSSACDPWFARVGNPRDSARRCRALKSTQCSPTPARLVSCANATTPCPPVPHPQSPRRKRRPAKSAKPAEPRLSRTRRPAGLGVADWQAALRRQFGREQAFALENLGHEPVFSDFRVHNPQSGTHYRVAIRGNGAGLQLLHLPRLRDQRPGHLQAHRVHAGQAGQAGAAARRHWRAASSPSTARSGSTTPARGSVRFRAGKSLPGRRCCSARGSCSTRTPAGPCPGTDSTAWRRLLRSAADSGHELRCHDDVWQFVAQIRDGERRQATLAEAYPKGAADKALAKLLKVKLYPYQAEGALFAARAGRCADRRRDGPGQDASRPSPRPSCSRATSACSACWWCARPRSSTSGRTSSRVSPSARRR